MAILPAYIGREELPEALSTLRENKLPMRVQPPLIKLFLLVAELSQTTSH
jgi:hypothetical protein